MDCESSGAPDAGKEAGGVGWSGVGGEEEDGGRGGGGEGGERERTGSGSISDQDHG